MSKARCLNDDVFFEVLSYLTTKTLAGLKLVSKGWQSLISDRSFAITQLRRVKPEVSGFIFQLKYRWSSDDCKTVLYIPIKKHEFQVHHTVFDFLPDDVLVFASCKGLICCRSCFPTRDPTIYICNPFNKQWAMLQCPGLDNDRSVGFAFPFDPHHDPVDALTNVKLVRVQQFHDVEEEEVEEPGEEMFSFTFQVFSFRTREWRTAIEACRSDEAISSWSKSVFVNGKLYWKTEGNKILAFEVENELSWLISVPTKPTERDVIPPGCIGESGGKLHFAMVSEEGLHILCLEDSFGCEWVLKHWLSLEAMESEYPRFFCNLYERVASSESGVNDTPWVNPLAFEDGLLLLRVSTKIYLFNVDTGEMNEVCEALELGPSAMFFPTVVPYAISLVPIAR